MPRLIELEPQFLRADIREEEYQRVCAGADPLNYTDADIETIRGPREYMIHVDTLDEAHGIWFLCPKCFVANGGNVGTHRVLVGFVGRAPPGTLSKNNEGKDSRWSPSGTGYDDLTLQPSIWCASEGACGWHGFVTNGEAA